MSAPTIIQYGASRLSGVIRQEKDKNGQIQEGKTISSGRWFNSIFNRLHRHHQKTLGPENTFNKVVRQNQHTKPVFYTHWNI